MCEPVTLAVVGSALAAAGTGANLLQQRGNAKAQNRYQDLLYAQNSDIAERSALTQYDQIARRISEEEAAAAQQIEESARQAIQVRGSAITAAGESGRDAGTFSSILSDLNRQEAEFRGNVFTSLRFRARQYRLEAEGARSQLQGQQLSFLPQPVARPDYFGSILSVAGSSLTTYGGAVGQEQAIRAARGT